MDKKDYKQVQNTLVKFLSKYLEKSTCKGFVVGISGGIDSAVVAKLCKISNPENVNAFLLPTYFSNDENLKDGIKLCSDLNIKYKIINIQNILNNFEETLSGKLDKYSMGNLSARIRMSILYHHSALLNSLVVGTSNKSELMLGYGTIYGDLACALNPIGELYKTEIFEFARFLEIDEKIINKAPSADLWHGQSDESDLGYSYKILDEVLFFIEKNGDNYDLLYEKFKNKELIDNVLSRINRNKFKRQMPKIAEI
ncbi:NAD synthetase, NH3-dependent [Campylobacter pinnipediorum subsp. caledonicus]|uniref:NAD+ synthase n=1 Tax=Campylobacter pinnipediorum TaxID=1965231 RepID=UPI000995D25F|nr:NAD+ synthase [Campylobacter pinnipediorum]AQW85863.1 NAD synthetase, NH3-dependent [Campylobacter pinnipediorum subsp. caledonicus]